MPILYISIAWLAGVFLGTLAAFPLWSLSIALPLLVAAFFVRSHRRAILTGGFCLLALLGGTLRYQSSLQVTDNTSLRYFNDKGTVLMQGMVSNAPETKTSSTQFEFSASTVTTENQTLNVKGNAMVRLPFYRQFRYGDVLQLKGRLEKAPQFEDFDYENYLANQGIYSLMNYPAATVVESGQGFAPMSWVYYLRERLSDTLSVCLPEPQGSLAQAILLGLRGNMSQTLVQSFYRTGTTHLIAISGLNLTILIGMLLPLTIRLFGRRNRIYIWLSLALIWLYTFLTGLPPTMVRAAIMASMFLLAESLGRQRNALAAMSFAAALMVAAEPGVLWDTSFQLSYLSMLGLVLISPYLIRFTGSQAGGTGVYVQALRNAVVISFGVTLAAIVATWPVTAINFHSISLVGAPATFFAMPSFPAIIGTSMVTAFAGLVWQPLGVLVGWASWLFLSYFLLVVSIFSAIPAAYVQSITIQPWQAVLYYLVLATGLLILKNWSAVRELLTTGLTRFTAALARAGNLPLRPFIYILLPLLLAANLLVWVAFLSLPDGRLHVTVLDVGQGESILITTPDGQKIIVDAGPDPMAACAALGTRLPFWDRKIDLLILTQLQSDHIAGAIELTHRYDVQSVALPPVESDSALSAELTATLRHADAKPVIMCEGQQLNLGRGLWLTVLHPPRQLLKGTTDDANNNSIVLRLAYDQISFLLASDIGVEAERYLADKRADLPSDVLKIAHHGSRNSTSDQFLSIVKPSVAVISAGIDNRFGHPNKYVLDRLYERVGSGRVFVTAMNGAVEFATDGKRLWCQCEHLAQAGN